MFIIEGKSISIPVLNHGPGWLAIDKPAGITVHNDPDHDIVSIIQHYLISNKKLHESLQFSIEFGVHAVNRLDKEVSGIELLSCNGNAARSLSRQIEEGKMIKQYLALLHGVLIPEKTGEDWNIWDSELTKEASGRTNPQGNGKRVPCVTHYRVLDVSIHYTLIECKLITGRKHQIRRHAKIAKHAVVGDDRYGTLRSVEFLKKQAKFMRLALHSYSLSFYDPQSGEGIRVQNNGLPDDMKTLFVSDKSTSKTIDETFPLVAQ